MLDKESDLPVTKQCKLLRVNRPSEQYQPAKVPVEDLAAMRIMDGIHLEIDPFLWTIR